MHAAVAAAWLFPGVHLKVISEMCFQVKVGFDVPDAAPAPKNMENLHENQNNVLLIHFKCPQALFLLSSGSQ